MNQNQLLDYHERLRKLNDIIHENIQTIMLQLDLKTSLRSPYWTYICMHRLKNRFPDLTLIEHYPSFICKYVRIIYNSKVFFIKCQDESYPGWINEDEYLKVVSTYEEMFDFIDKSPDGTYEIMCVESKMIF
jgi:hypothetical protein